MKERILAENLLGQAICKVQIPSSKIPAMQVLLVRGLRLS